MTNDKLNITEKIKRSKNCNESKIIYATQCCKHKVLYIGHTEEQLSELSTKHRYGIKNTPHNSQLAKIF